MERNLTPEYAEGEIGLVIDYVPGESKALDVLSGAMGLIAAIDNLDRALLSSVNTELEPVSILNDVQHSSLKLLLARVLNKVPDEHLSGLEWKKWVGGLLVKGKYLLLQNLDADAPTIEKKLLELEPIYREAPVLVPYDPPSVKNVQEAINEVAKARRVFDGQRVTVQTELGDVALEDHAWQEVDTENSVVSTLTNKGREYLKVRYPDMLGQAQWTVMRGGRSVRVEILHKAWIDDYHERKFVILPGDSLDCSFEEHIGYDAQRNEIERKISIIEVFDVVSPPSQKKLGL